MTKTLIMVIEALLALTFVAGLWLIDVFHDQGLTTFLLTRKTVCHACNKHLVDDVAFACKVCIELAAALLVSLGVLYCWRYWLRELIFGVSSNTNKM